MNKRQKKKKLYMYQIVFPYDYHSEKRVRRFIHSLTKRKNNRWRTRIKAHKSEMKKAIKDMYRFYAGEIDFEKVFENRYI